MDDNNNHSVVQEATKDKFKRSKTLESKEVPRYPQSAERELIRINRAYMRLLNELLKEELPIIVEHYKESRTDARFDWKVPFATLLKQSVLRIAQKLEKALAKYNLEKHVSGIAATLENQSVREWKRTVKKTLGINIFEDYYKGEMYTNVLDDWISTNVRLIKSMPQETLTVLEQDIWECYQNGDTVGSLRDKIRSDYNTSKEKATFLARDQVATLSGQMAKMQQTDAGVKKYRWSTSKDGRVRECHAELDGQIIDWDDPPEMWYETNEGIVYTGRFCHPGEDFQCRCVAIPVFDRESIDLPISE